MNSIISAILNIFSSLMSIFQKREEAKIEEKKVAQSEKNIEKAEKIEDVKIRDKNEGLIKDIQTAPNEIEKQKLLDELRKRVSA